MEEARRRGSSGTSFSSVDDLRDQIRSGILHDGIELLPACAALKASLPSDSWTQVWENMLEIFLTKALAFTPAEEDENKAIIESKGLELVSFFLKQSYTVNWDGKPFAIDKPYKLIDLVARLCITWRGASNFHSDFRPAVLNGAESVLSGRETPPAPRAEGFEATSLLHRAGIFFYSHAVTAAVKASRLQDHGRKIQAAYMRVRWHNFTAEIVEDQLLLPLEALPAQEQHYTRIVLLGDSHAQHLQLEPLPQGDVLIHTGDLSNEEAFSIDADKFHRFVANYIGLSDPQSTVNATELRRRLAQILFDAGKEDLDDFTDRLRELMRSERFMLHACLSWLRRQGAKFKKVALVGGNHDYILGFITPDVHVGAAGTDSQCVARGLCALYGVEYLWTGRAPVDLAGVTVYGSGVSFNRTASAEHNVSGLTAFRIDPTAEAAEDVENAIAASVDGAEVDVLLTHGDFAAGSHGAAKRPGLLFGGQCELPTGTTRERTCAISRGSLPLLYAYGDSHNAAGGGELHTWARLRPLCVDGGEGDGATASVPSIFTAVVSTANFLDSIPRVVDVRAKRHK